MAATTLPVSPTPRFSQSTYDGDFIDRLLLLAEKAITRTELSLLSSCRGESPESSYGASDGGWPCRKNATIHDPRTGQSWCVACFEGVILG